MENTQTKRWLSVIIILLITIVSFWIAINPEWVARLGSWGYVGAFLVSLVASATIVLPAPGLAVIIAMSTSFDPVLLGIVGGIGSAVGELSGYIAGATGNALIPKEQRKHIDWLQPLTEKYGGWLLGLFSAIPFPLFDLAGMIAGVVRMPIWVFLLSVSIGKSLKYIFLIWIGAGPLAWLQEYL